MSRKWEPIDPDHWLQRYLAEESAYKLAGEAGVSQTAFENFLDRNGVMRRNCAAANKLRMARMTSAERSALVIDAQVASRGRIVSESELIRRAKTREQRATYIGRWEREVSAELSDRGLQNGLQMAVGRYNLDVGLWPLDVELHHGAGQPHWTRYGQRIKYLADLGWHSVYVTFVKELHIARVCDQLVTLLEKCQGRPPERGHYWVIRGSVQYPSISKGQLD